MIQSLIVSMLLSVGLATPQPAQETQHLQNEKNYYIENEKNTMAIFKEASPLVVSVDSTRQTHHFFSSHNEEIPAGSGSGFLWDDKGHIITNFHVIQGALNGSSQIWVSTKEGKRYKAKLVGAEPRKDIAVLKVSGIQQRNQGFSKKTANSEQLQVGQKVLAIGSPFGFEQTLTTGIVSAKNRSMPSVLPSVTIRNMIQTDASINPGNSGGPLLDSRGYLAGMNTAIVSGSGTSAGIGFAVPANTIKRVANQIIQYGEVKQPGLGIISLTAYQKKMLSRYDFGYDLKDGVIIASVEPGSPADKAGLQGIKEHPRLGVRLGDIITAIDGVKVKSFDDLYNTLSEKKVGDVVKVEYQRMGRTMTQSVRLMQLSHKA